MSRILAVLAAFAFAAVLAVTGTAPALAHTARSVRTASAPPPCAAGYYAVQDNHTGTYITGTGINNPVVLGGGNCFERITEGALFSLQNADGHCLWNNGGTFELGKACAGRTSELLDAYTQHSGGFWSVYSASSPAGWWDTVANGCETGSDIGLTFSNPNTSCDWFSVLG